MSFGGSSYGGVAYGGGDLLPPPPGEISETAFTDDDLAGTELLARGVAEGALTDDVVVATHSAAVSETALTADSLLLNVVLDRNLTEGAATVDTITNKPVELLFENANTDDSLGTHEVLHPHLAETAFTADTIFYAVVKHARFTATTVVAPTFSAFQTFIPPAPVPGTYLAFHDYEVVVCDKYGIAQGQITSAVPTEIEWVLDGLGEALIDCWILDPSLKQLVPITAFPGAVEIQIWRDQVLIWWGWPTGCTFDAKQVHLTCSGLLYPFSVRSFGPVTVNYLLNPSFEQPAPGGAGDVPEWNVSGVTAFPINQVNPWGAPILLGTQAILLIQADAGVDTYIEQDVNVEGGEQGLFFDLSAWVYLLPGTTYGDALDQRGLFVQLVVGGISQDVEFQAITSDIGQGGWTRLETGIDVPPGVTGTLNVRLYAPQGITVWDAVTLSVEESRGSGPNGSDASVIMDIIVNYAQDPAFGKNDVAIAPCPSIPFANPPTGTTLIRVYQFSDNSGIMDALNEYPSIGVCDFEVVWDATGHHRTFRTYAPSKGSIKYNYPLEIDVSNITDLQGAIDGTQTVTSARVLGQGSSGSSEDIGFASFPSFLGGRWVGDGTVTQGSTHITSPTINFTDDDIGEGIYVLVPGGVLPIGCTIDTIVSPTECTFTNNALAQTGAPTPALLSVERAIVGIGGVIVESVGSALTDLPISTLQGTAETTLLTQQRAEFLPTARQRADGPDGLFGVVQTGDVIPVVFNYGWLTFGPVLMRVASLTLYPPTEELEVQLNPMPILQSSYGG